MLVLNIYYIFLKIFYVDRIYLYLDIPQIAKMRNLYIFTLIESVIFKPLLFHSNPKENIH